MAVYITVTNNIVGSGTIYPHLGRRGRPLSVPQYSMIVKNDSGSEKLFKVTRDTVDTIKKNRIGNDECPPSKINTMYTGIVRKGEPKGFRIELYEKGTPKKGEAHGIRGTGKNIRYNVQIHLGPAKSEGCILLTGWKRGRAAFESTVKQFIQEDEKHQQANPGEIYVIVKKR